MSATLRDLRYFLATADAMHFGRAARACFVSQPTLSAGIQRLERQLGVQLFERTTRSVLMTSAGATLLDGARRLVRDAEAFQEQALDLRDSTGGTLHLGVIPTVGPYLLPHLMPSVRSELPRVSIRLHERITDELLADLRGGTLDAAILSDPFDEEGLTTTPLFEEPFVLALPDDHDLCECGVVPIAELVDVDLLLLDEGHCMREQVMEICSGVTTDARSTFGSTTLETLRNMVAAGEGCTLLPILAVDPARIQRGVTIRSLVAPVPARKISLAWRTTFARESVIRRLAEIARGCAPDSVQSLGWEPSSGHP